SLVAVNVLVYLLQQSNPTIITRFAMRPVSVADGEYYRMLTAAFLHASLMHILFNMLALWIVGPALEAALGRVRFLPLYVVGGLVAGGALALSFMASERLEPAVRTFANVGAVGAVVLLLVVLTHTRTAELTALVGLPFRL